MTPSPTGRGESRDGHDSIVLERTFDAPIESVWAAVTDSDRLERWIGTWTGDPGSGAVLFVMGDEGEEVQPETYRIDACEPPRLLVLTTQVDGEPDVWHLRLELTEDAGATTLTFVQPVPSAEQASSIGPGWEYYLDRLVAAESGGDVTAIDFDDYYPAMSEHYRTLFT